MSRRMTSTDSGAPPLKPITEKTARAAHSPTEEELVAVCRTAVGDTLRSIVHFTSEASELLYLRADLYGENRRRALEVKASLVERERVGLESTERYAPHAAGAGSDPVLGDYEFTVRVFSDGYVCRIIAGDDGLLLTAEDLDIGRVEEVAVALRGLVAAAYGH